MKLSTSICSLALAIAALAINAPAQASKSSDQHKSGHHHAAAKSTGKVAAKHAKAPLKSAAKGKHGHLTIAAHGAKSHAKGHAKHVAHAAVSHHVASRVVAAPKAVREEAVIGPLKLQSSAVVVQDQSSGAMLYEKNPDAVVPIASITKLMTAMVTIDSRPNLREELTVADADVDALRHSTSHVPVGTVLPREDMLRLALMSSENRAASSLARYYPGGTPAFVAAMNRKAQILGLKDTRFFDATGLNAGNVSSARDLARMVAAAATYPLIREFTTTAEYDVKLGRGMRTFHNTNSLVKSDSWEIGVSKTGYISESGKCLVMQAWFNNKPTIVVLLDSAGRYTRQGDANRVKKWIESNVASQVKTARQG